MFGQRSVVIFQPQPVVTGPAGSTRTQWRWRKTRLTIMSHLMQMVLMIICVSTYQLFERPRCGRCWCAHARMPGRPTWLKFNSREIKLFVGEIISQEWNLKGPSPAPICCRVIQRI